MISRNIHQVWESSTVPPVKLRILSETWKTHHPNWNFFLWRRKEMNQLVKEYFPDLFFLYHNLPYNVQRWDMIRYMILYVFGGLYIDFDTECFKSIEPLINEKTICFGEEPPKHNIHSEFKGKKILTNAFMYSQPMNESWLFILSEIEKNINHYQNNIVINTTGPLMLTRNQEALFNDFNANIISYQDVSPVTKKEVYEYAYGVDINTVPDKIRDAYCAHYFFGSWDDNHKLYK